MYEFEESTTAGPARKLTESAAQVGQAPPSSWRMSDGVVVAMNTGVNPFTIADVWFAMIVSPVTVFTMLNSPFRPVMTRWYVESPMAEEICWISTWFPTNEPAIWLALMENTALLPFGTA